MFLPHRRMVTAFCCLSFAVTSQALAQDWPQWRGPNREARVQGFKAPESWPEELTRKWTVEVGDGVATPSLVGDRLYVIARQEENEIVRCLDAASGKEIWQDKYASGGAPGPARRYSGPRSSPAIANGKVITLGVQGMLRCYDAKMGKLLWRHDELVGSIPRFAVSSSPVIVDGLCIAQLGSENGGVMAYDLETGKERWKWTGDGPCYGSPVVTSIDGKDVLVAPTDGKLVALDASSGELLWEASYRQGRYNAASPIVSGQTLIVAGPTRGMTAWKLVKDGEKLRAQDVWRNDDASPMFNTPVLREGLVFGLSSRDDLFCINLKNGETTWSAPFAESSRSEENEAEEDDRRGDRRRGRRGRGRRGGGGRGGYGSVVDAGSVLFALTPAGQLTVFEPTSEKLKRLATYRVAEGGTHAYPVIAGKRIYIKDGNSVTLYTIE